MTLRAWKIREDLTLWYHIPVLVPPSHQVHDLWQRVFGSLGTVGAATPSTASGIVSTRRVPGSVMWVSLESPRFPKAHRAWMIHDNLLVGSYSPIVPQHRSQFLDRACLEVLACSGSGSESKIGGMICTVCTGQKWVYRFTGNRMPTISKTWTIGVLKAFIEK